MRRLARGRPFDRRVGAEWHARRDRSGRRQVQRLDSDHALIGDVPRSSAAQELERDDGKGILVGPTIEIRAIATLLERHIGRRP
jgi:hypothetical protein